ncbi:methyltransferase domain-containing protein [Nonomuraea glycinis]|uniref:Protein-L-isoaspartate O-methyltransferase n=1 Tax=Nonomuraea glycinis TaxID=2047744 RepID=A0A918ACI0_9ACTN|nr:methyltransferase domain-containing protein [Nonomuraea glycinis]MCA2179548.1 methyltransferase domain-containing protein [Nonomuraea glycinis]GGP15422.1 protein-L-isoaspartate O-methyltransferase [Nonomuraea glycinis]
MTDLGPLLDTMIARIETVRSPMESRIERALRSVPRHEYVPPVALIVGNDRPPILIDREADPELWLRGVYTETALVTQLDDGATELRDLDGSYSSSSSAPATVADLLELLDPRPGDRVLEVGTGTGWTAALLCHLAGEANVTSVEVDPSLAEAAAKNLAAAGLRPHLIVGDGADGAAERAPFDRVHVTCAVRTVPYAWVEQCRPGGVIVTPMQMGVGEGHVLRLVVLPDGTAQGRFREYASYMTMRSQRYVHLPDPEGVQPRESTTRVDPRMIAGAPPGARLTIAALAGVRLDTRAEPECFRAWVSSTVRPQEKALVIWEEGRTEYTLYELSDRQVWEEVVAAYFQWVRWGEPRRDRFGMTVAPDGQRYWLDTPGRVIG